MDLLNTDQPTSRGRFLRQLGAAVAAGIGVSLVGAGKAQAGGGYCMCDDGTRGCGGPGNGICYDSCSATSCCLCPWPWGTDCTTHNIPCPCG